MRISDWSSDVCSSDLHAALFGVYGFLSLGFVLMVLRYIRPEIAFNEGLMRTGFWGLNAGLVLMIFTSLLPVGLFQFEASVTTGMWYARRSWRARSEEHTSELQSLLRISSAVFCLKKQTRTTFIVSTISK